MTFENLNLQHDPASLSPPASNLEWHGLSRVRHVLRRWLSANSGEGEARSTVEGEPADPLDMSCASLSLSPKTVTEGWLSMQALL